MRHIPHERKLLQSRIAQRVFGLFVACAIVPLTLLATLSFFGVTRQLETQAKQDLRRSVKAEGMSLVSRLSVAQSELESLLTMGDRPPGSADPLDPSDPARLASERFSGIQVLDSSRSPVWEWGTTPPLELLSEKDWKRLNGGHGILRTIPSGSGHPDIALFVPSREAPTRLAAATLSSNYVWNKEAVEAESDERQCFDTNGIVLFRASASGSFPYPGALRSEGRTSGEFKWKADGEEFVGASWTTFLKYTYDVEWTFAEARPKSVVMAPVQDFLFSFGLVCGLSLLIVVILSSTLIRKHLEPIRTLQDATTRIAREDFGTLVDIDTDDELAELGQSFNAMSKKLGSHLRARRALIDFGVALAGESRETEILRIMLDRATEIFRAGGAFVLSVDNAGKPTTVGVKPNPKRSHTRILSSDHFDSKTFEPLAARFRDTRSLTVTIGPDDRDVAPALTEIGFQPQASQGAICLPLRDHESEFQGLLVVLPHSERDSASVLSPDRIEVGKLFSSMAGAALSQSRLVAGFKALFDGMGQMIATAIDEKSPYTYEHCQRVPVITMMIADRAAAAASGPMESFSLTEDERYELEVAALLHDCGKVVTPVHVVDKATKLETIWDRIHMVEHRYEIILRDMVIRSLRQSATTAGPPEEKASPPRIGTLLQREAKTAEALQLKQDLEFLRACNRGAEYMPSDAQTKVRDIAERYHFETATGEVRPLLTEDEVKNLQVSRGTLTEDEIQIIRNHASASIRMLEKLPYPRKLHRVPLIAGAHHERMDGKGYPNGIEIGKLPVQARILALADVFEALTAKDRPYKDGKKLSEVLTIMGRMTEDGHLDPMVFDFFVREGIYLDYAHLKLDAVQIDDVDLDSLPGFNPRQAA